MAAYRIRFSDRARLEDLPNIDLSVRAGIAIAIEGKLATAPEIFGKPLRHTPRGLRTLHVGHWRVIFRIEGNVVRILTIRHRSKGYGDLKA